MGSSSHKVKVESRQEHGHKYLLVVRPYRKVHRLKKRFLGVDIDFKDTFNSMSQVSLWSILETCNVPNMDLLKSLYEHTTVLMSQTGMDSVNLKTEVKFNTGVTKGGRPLPSPLLPGYKHSIEIPGGHRG
jgi:hypothetical protein